MNETIIAINLSVFVFGLMSTYFGWTARGQIESWGWFRMADFSAFNLFTYQFLHGGLMHIGFNMLFLWVFGNAVEGRLGRIGYLVFYLSSGVFAAVAYGLFDPQVPMIGASGSIAGVSGGFLALFPRAKIRVLWFLFYIGVFVWPASLFVLFYFALDLLNQLTDMLHLRGTGAQDVAYAAHLAGNVFGFMICFSLLAFGVLKREEFDIFFLVKQMQRRRAMRTVSKSNPGVWDQPKADTAEQMGKRKAPKRMSVREREYAERRAEISTLMSDHQLDLAADRYVELLRDFSDATMPEQRHVDLANHLYQRGDTDQAARAYELFIRAYPRYRGIEHVKLVLAMIYSRRTPPDDSRSRAILEEVLPRLDGEEQLLAESLLEQLGPAKDVESKA